VPLKLKTRKTITPVGSDIYIVYSYRMKRNKISKKAVDYDNNYDYDKETNNKRR
jgi:hypothetical protein